MEDSDMERWTTTPGAEQGRAAKTALQRGKCVTVENQLDKMLLMGIQGICKDTEGSCVLCPIPVLS